MPVELIIGRFGVLTTPGGYATGMIGAAFAAVPRRLPVLAATAGVLAAAAFTVCLVAVSIDALPCSWAGFGVFLLYTVVVMAAVAVVMAAAALVLPQRDA